VFYNNNNNNNNKIPVIIDLVDDVNMISDFLFFQIFLHVRYKIFQLLKPVTIRHNDTKLVWSIFRVIILV